MSYWGYNTNNFLNIDQERKRGILCSYWLAKLKQIDVEGPVLETTGSYLVNRRQVVVVGSFRSKEKVFHFQRNT